MYAGDKLYRIKVENERQARKEISTAIKLLGDSIGTVVWDVMGDSRFLRDHVSRYTAHPINVHEAKD